MKNKNLSLLLIFLICALPTAAVAQQPEEPAAADTIKIDPVTKLADYNTPRKYIVNNITVSGVKYIPTDNLGQTVGLVKGEEVKIPGPYVTNAIKNLLGRNLFPYAEVIAVPDGDSVNFEITLREVPVVNQWVFEGIRKGQATELTEKLELKQGRGTRLSDYIIDKNIGAIQRFYSEKGFRNTQVGVRIENDTIYKNLNAVNVIFEIDRGAKVKIGQINFAGNENFSANRLRRSLKKTHQKSWNIFQSSKLNDKEYQNDLQVNLIDFYNSKGYRNAMVIRDSIYVIDDKHLGIDIVVDEGNMYYYRNVSWVGNSVYPTEDLNRMLGIQKGDIYDRTSMHKALGVGAGDNPEEFTVNALYQNNGYLFSRIEPTETIVGRDSIDLEIKIFEGKQATINNVNISGNERVNDEVIRRELRTRPGELYSREMIMATMRELSQMKHFNPETVGSGLNISPVTNEKVDISWNLEETPSDQFEISGGVGGSMFVGSVGVQLNNLSIKRLFEKGAWRPYPSGQNQSLAIRAQTNGTYYKAFSLSFMEPWLGGKKPISLSISSYYSDQNDATYAWQKANRYFRTLGISAGIGRRLTWPDPYFTLYMGLNFQSYNMKDWYDFVVQNGSSNIVSFNAVFGRNSVDNPIYPRSGSDFSVSLTLTPPYSLWDGKDYSDPDLSNNQRYKWIEYHKWVAKGSWFTTLGNSNKWVVMAKAELGYLGYYDRFKKSPFEGFDVGGSGMSGYNVYGVDIVGLRGYEDGALTPNTDTKYASVYNKYTIELRYPFILQGGTQIYGLAFIEGGNAYDGWKNFNPFQIKRAAGVGIRVNLQIVGMLGVDWGYGFDKPNNGTTNKRSGGEIAFTFGQQF